jgi:hypothetical protein
MPELTRARRRLHVPELAPTRTWPSLPRSPLAEITRPCPRPSSPAPPLADLVEAKLAGAHPGRSRHARAWPAHAPGRSRRGRARGHLPLVNLSAAEPGRRSPLAELAGCRRGRSRRGRGWPSSLAPNPGRSSPAPWHISSRSSLAELAGAMAGVGYIVVNWQEREKII